jgi:YesN/AraC family two-component response regulator
VLEAPAGPEAIELCDRVHVDIDLLVTDLVMPGMSGVELASQLTRRRPGLRVLTMSGYTEHALVEDGMLEGMPFLSKPFTPAELAESVGRVLEGPAALAA